MFAHVHASFPENKNEQARVVAIATSPFKAQDKGLGAAMFLLCDQRFKFAITTLKRDLPYFHSDLGYVLRYINKLEGLIPYPVSLSARLRALKLAVNKLLVQIPNARTSLLKVTQVNFNVTELRGHLPNAMACLSKMIYLWIGSNKLRGQIPNAITALLKMTELNLDSNELSGYVPNAMASLSNLISLSIGRNKLSGHIPNAMASLSKMDSLDLKENKLRGPMPDAVGSSGFSSGALLKFEMAATQNDRG